MINSNLMFGSATDLWSTPQALFDKLNKRFGFTLDVCATTENAKCSNFFDEAANALNKEWYGVCWMNPPYGRDIGKWVRKARLSSEKDGVTVCCLLPARTDTAWWHYDCALGQVYFIRGRLKFGDAKNCAPFPSAVVVFDGISSPSCSHGLYCLIGEY